ncbi:Uncharacterized protein HZ326_11175 [Fusarium oxysporum f. sp. albedinis]|nr:Uncharacterized protein HZ326_11175 [Fusarium oxysporum f. sp. albedinis]
MIPMHPSFALSSTSHPIIKSISCLLAVPSCSKAHLAPGQVITQPSKAWLQGVSGHTDSPPALALKPTSATFMCLKLLTIGRYRYH